MTDRGEWLRGRKGARVSPTAYFARALAPLAVSVRSFVDRRIELRLGQSNALVLMNSRQARGDTFVSFGDGELRYLRRVGNRVVDWGRAPLPLGALRAGAVDDAPAVGATLAETFGDGGRRRRVVVGLGARDARVCLLSLPWVKERDLAAVVADDAPRALGVSTETHYIFWQRVRIAGDERRVYVAAVPRGPLLATLEACKIGGLVVESLDLVPLALARAANQRDAIVLAVEPDSVEIVVVADDLPLLFRSVPLAPAAIPVEIAAEASRALSAYEDAFPDRELDRTAPVYLAGRVGTERSAELIEPLRARTGRPVGRPSPPMHLPADFPIAEQLVNIGLALK